MSLKYRIAAVIFILEAVMMVIVLSLTFSSANNFIQGQVKENEDTIIALISNLSRAAFIINEYDDLQPYVEQAVQAPHIDKIMIMDTHDVVLVSSDSLDIGLNYSQVRDSQSQDWNERQINNASGFLGKIAIKYSHQQLQAATQQSFNAGTAAAIIGMTIIAFIGIVTGTLLTRRLQIVSNTAKEMSSGNLSARANLKGSDEIADLGDAFDDMADKLKQQFSSLKQREAELDSIREQLENRVQQRTEELAKARDEAISANNAKSAFLATMSHEIRTPMTAIIGFAELLRDPNLQQDDLEQATHAILTSGDHLLQLINDILDLAKIEADKLALEILPITPADIITQIREIVKPFADKNNVSFFDNTITPLPEFIHTDAVRLKQILLNLCNNAIKFSENGFVNLNFGYNKQTDTMRIDIIDTGIGMSPEQLEKIFNRFEQADSSTTRKYGGTGLGLALTKELVTLLKGTIDVESTLGKGTHFTIHIPCASETPIDNHKPSISRPATEEIKSLPKLTGRVLLAEDTELLQLMIGKTIRLTGAQVTFAQNGEEAVQLSGLNAYDLIFMDMQMPQMDGISAVHAIRQRGDKTPIIMLTANVLKTDQLRCIEAGCDEFISKPINRQTLYTILDKYLCTNTEAENNQELA